MKRPRQGIGKRPRQALQAWLGKALANVPRQRTVKVPRPVGGQWLFPDRELHPLQKSTVQKRLATNCHEHPRCHSTANQRRVM